MLRELGVAAGDALLLERMPRDLWKQGMLTLRVTVERGPAGSPGAFLSSCLRVFLCAWLLA